MQGLINLRAIRLALEADTAITTNLYRSSPSNVPHLSQHQTAIMGANAIPSTSDPKDTDTVRP